MSWGYSTLIIAPALASLGLSAALPTFDPRDIVNNDVIRFMKCGNLFTVRPDVGGFEGGMAGYWANVNDLGPPNERVTFDMATRVDDYFYNNKHDYAGKSDDGKGGMSLNITEPTSDPNPQFALYTGYAKRNVGNTVSTYNCFTDSLEFGFEYEDEKLGTCKSWVWCVQKDALRVSIDRRRNITVLTSSTALRQGDRRRRYRSRPELAKGRRHIRAVPGAL